VPFRLLLTPPLPGPDNMAIDDALLDRARATGESVLRVYAWDRPTLSFGRHQTARALYDPRRLEARGVDVVRRPTGGRAVLHHREVTYSVTAPLADEGSLRASYARINRLLLDGLRRLGVDARLAAPAGRAPLPDGAPCFETPTEGELVAATDGGRAEARLAKLVGSAQWRDDGALLQHGSILVDDDQTRVGELATRPLPTVPPPATLRQALGRAPSLEEVADALFAAARALEDPDATPLCVDAPLREAADRARARYADAAWTWRR
jgi:lipoyl(octanoyl) transferase